MALSGRSSWRRHLLNWFYTYRSFQFIPTDPLGRLGEVDFLVNKDWRWKSTGRFVRTQDGKGTGRENAGKEGLGKRSHTDYDLLSCLDTLIMIENSLLKFIFINLG